MDLWAAMQERSGAGLGKGQDSAHRAGKGEVPIQARAVKGFAGFIPWRRKMTQNMGHVGPGVLAGLTS